MLSGQRRKVGVHPTPPGAMTAYAGGNVLVPVAAQRQDLASFPALRVRRATCRGHSGVIGCHIEHLLILQCGRDGLHYGVLPRALPVILQLLGQVLVIEAGQAREAGSGVALAVGAVAADAGRRALAVALHGNLLSRGGVADRQGGL